MSWITETRRSVIPVISYEEAKVIQEQIKQVEIETKKLQEEQQKVTFKIWVVITWILRMIGKVLRCIFMVDRYMNGTATILDLIKNAIIIVLVSFAVYVYLVVKFTSKYPQLIAGYPELPINIVPESIKDIVVLALPSPYD
jgi:hypothetical protein